MVLVKGIDNPPAALVKDDFENGYLTKMSKLYFPHKESFIKTTMCTKLSAEKKLTSVATQNPEGQNSPGFEKTQSPILSSIPHKVSSIEIPSITMDTILFKKISTENKLTGWLESVGKTSTPKLIFRASINGWSSADFHRKCDGKEATLTIVKTTQNDVIGGYSDIPWSSKRGYIYSTESFLFKLNGRQSIRMNIRDGQSVNAVYHNEEYGPTFGGGFDLCIKSYSNAKSGNTTRSISHSYKAPPSTTDTGTDPYFLAGCKYFIVADYEVFQV